jgi:FAD synthetase
MKNESEKRKDARTIVVATGTFDLLHPGHLYYLKESRALGDELHVIVARDKNVLHKPAPIVPEIQRVVMVSALSSVTSARLGDPTDMMRPIEEIKPDIITLGCNQHFSEQDLEKRLRERGLVAQVIRIGEYKQCTYCSSRDIMQSILERECQKQKSMK